MESNRNRSSRGDRNDDDRGSRSSSRDRDDRDADDRSRGRDRGADRDDRSHSDRESRRGSSIGYEYSSRSADDVAKRATMGNNEFDKYLKDHIKTWKPADGLNDIRILPPTWKNPKHYGIDIYLHYAVGPDRQSYLDLQKMLDKPDPIAEERDAALREGDEDLAKDLESKRRSLVYLIDRNDEREGVQAWAMPFTVDRDICKISIDAKTREVLPIDHPEDGYDVQFDKTGQKRNTKYSGVAIARRSSPLGNDRWLEYAIDNPLPEQLVYFDYEAIAKEFGSAGAHRDRRDAEREREDRSERGGERGRRDMGRDRDDRDRGSARDSDDRDRVRERVGREVDDRDDARSTRGNGRDRDRGGARDSRSSGTELDWRSIHEMTGTEMEDLVKEERLNINPNKVDSDAELADWICEEMKIDKPAGRQRARLETQQKEDDPRERLREMRDSRERR